MRTLASRTEGWTPCARCSPPRATTSPAARSGCTRSSGTACACSPTSVTAGVRMTSRNDNDITVAWPELSTSPLGERDLLVDGEIIALNEHGLPDFRVLPGPDARPQRADRAAGSRRPSPRPTWSSTCSASTARTSRACRWRSAGPASRVSGCDTHLAGAGGVRRRGDALRGHPGPGPRGRGEQAPPVDATVRPAHGLLAQARPPANASFVVGGWRPQDGYVGRHLAALLVGELTADGLLYRGRVGSGIGRRPASS